jgi:hypothetical protein
LEKYHWTFSNVVGKKLYSDSPFGRYK